MGQWPAHEQDFVCHDVLSKGMRAWPEGAAWGASKRQIDSTFVHANLFAPGQCLQSSAYESELGMDP